MLHVFFVADKYRNLYCVVLCTVHTLYLHCLLLTVRRVPTSYFIYCIIYCTALYECTYDYSGPPYMYIHIVKYEHNLYRDLFYLYNKGVPIYFLLIYLGVLCPYLRESTMHLCCIVKRAGTVYWEDNVPGSLLPVSGFHRCLFFKAAEKGWGVVEIYLDNKKLVLINIIFFYVCLFLC